MLVSKTILLVVVLAKRVLILQSEDFKTGSLMSGIADRISGWFWIDVGGPVVTDDFSLSCCCCSGPPLSPPGALMLPSAPTLEGLGDPDFWYACTHSGSGPPFCFNGRIPGL